ncbi:helix-turn-helix domain-containing protein [uncultured Tateyamaria sp.]|uniref:GlxA family transcriptional regulator n=1 Tax=uncultured Tateyamaria sp. TaxID=455651 RepID=UPI00261ED026|nr:helix-turn-helix domain-containing protein [uncultured Tateyamaria sp.]
MTPFYAKDTPRDVPPDAPMNVLFVVYPDIVLLDLVGPLQVFTHATKGEGAGPAYRTHVVSLAGGATATNTILPIGTDPLADWLDPHCDVPIHTVVFVGGDGAIPAALDADFVAQATVLARRAGRVCSVCSGALVLAATGLLDGKRAVTHWEDCDKLAADYPAVAVEVDPIFIKDGHVWTSAGITAGIDMALAMIEEDLGKPAAIAMARSLVAPMVRSGGQSQFSAELDRQARDADGLFSPLHAWISDNLARRLTVEDMARECGMSPRNFSRRYANVMGVSPAKALEVVRVDAARDLLATTDKGVKVIAKHCGFQDAERMRRAFLRVARTTPSKYRQQFRLT